MVGEDVVSGPGPDGLLGLLTPYMYDDLDGKNGERVQLIKFSGLAAGKICMVMI
jgi:hypothetical protein